MTDDTTLRLTQDELHFEVLKERHPDHDFWLDTGGYFWFAKHTDERAKKLGMVREKPVTEMDFKRVRTWCSNPTTDVAAAMALVLEAPEFHLYREDGVTQFCLIDPKEEDPLGGIIVKGTDDKALCLAAGGSWLSWKRGVRVELKGEGE